MNPLDPASVMRGLRQWAAEHCLPEHPIHRGVMRQALSALLHRVLKFGPEAGLAQCTGRDLTYLASCMGGPGAAFFLRTALVRGIVEDDSELVTFLLALPLCPEVLLWIQRLMAWVMANDEPSVQAMLEWLQSLHAAGALEELTLATVIITRVHPQLANPDFLEYVPLDYPPLAAALCRVLMVQPHYRNRVIAWLGAHPVVRWSMNNLTEATT